MSLNEPHPEDLIPVKEAARRAGVSEALVRDWYTSGELPHYRLGRKGKRGKVGIAPADLAAFLAGRRVEARENQESAPPSPPTTRPPRTGGDFGASYSRHMERINRKFGRS